MEIVIRSAATFVILFFIMRMMGKQQLTELSPFEMVLLVVMGDLAQQAVTQEDMSVTGAVLAIGTMALLVWGLSVLRVRSTRARIFIDGVPIVVVQDGSIVAAALRQEHLTEDDVLDAARQRGIADLREVQLGILEPDGRFSFLTGSSDDVDEPEKSKAT